MALKGDTKITENSGTDYILIPKPLRSDSQFPFQDDDLLEMEVIGDKIIIRKRGRSDEQEES